MSRALLAVLLFASLAAAAANEALLPAPSAIALHGGSLRIGPATPLVVAPGDIAAQRVAANLAELLARSHGMQVPVRTERARGAIRFVRIAEGPPESYRLEVRKDGATISASSDAGFAHAATSLWQLASRSGRAVSLPTLTLEDSPRFSWRAIALDSERRFHSPAFVRRLVDWMWVRKLNVLHWRLAGPSAWRLEIRSRPRPARASGWYSQDTVRAIVAYAAERGIAVVPRFDAPGDAVGDEALREVIALFPNPYIDYPGASQRLVREGRTVPDAAALHVAPANAVPAELYARDPAAESRARLLGVEAAIGDGSMAAAGRLRFPAADVIAELGWSPPGARDWRDFSRRAEALAAK